MTRGGAPRTVLDAKVLKTTTPRWSDDQRTLAYAEKGEVFVQRIDEEKPRSITPKPKRIPERRRRPPAKTKPSRSRSVSFSRDGSKLLLTSKKGWYVASVADGTRDRVLTLDDKNEDKNPKLTAVDWTPPAMRSWCSTASPIAGTAASRGSISRRKTLTPLARDANLYQGFRQSRDGSTIVFQKSDGTRPAELYAADQLSRNVRKLTDLNPWIAKKALPASELVSYRDADGKVLYGVLRYPVGYEKGRTLSDRVRALRNVLRQRLQRPRRAARRPGLRRLPPVGESRRRPARASRGRRA